MSCRNPSRDTWSHEPDDATEQERQGTVEESSAVESGLVNRGGKMAGRMVQGINRDVDQSENNPNACKHGR